MAVAFDGFSIREYAANMRNIDFEKCWPFDGGRFESLPEISVRKFRFWSDELKTEASGDAEEMAAKTPSSKAKQRTPKKRSIVELFAVAPQMEAAETDGSGGDDDDDDDEEEEEKKEEEEKNKGKEDMVMKIKKIEMMMMMKKKKKKKKKKKMKKMKKKKEWMDGKIVKKKRKLKIEICAAKKDAMHKMWSGKNSRNPADSRSQKKSTYIKNLPKKRNFKLQCSKLISKKRRGPGKVLPVHSILRNSSKASSKKARAETDMQGGNLINFCCESAKHVTFSDKDDIIGHVRSCSSIDIPQLQNLCKIFSDVLAASSALDNRHKVDQLPSTTDGTQMEKLTDINVSTSILDMRDGTTSCENQQSTDSHAEVIIPPTNTEMSSVFISEDQNHVTLGNIGSGNQRILESNSEQLSSHSVAHGKETSQRISDSDSRSVTTPLRKCASRFDTMSSLSFIGNSNSNPPQSIFEIGRQTQQHAVPVNDTCWHITEFQPMHQQLPSKDLRESMQIHKERCLGEDFVGLPLNSQGELIQLQSGARFGLNEISKRQNAQHGPIFNYPVHSYSESRSSVSHVKLLKGKYPGSILDQQFHVSKPYGIGFSNLQSLERLEAQRNNRTFDKDRVFHHESNMRQVSCYGCREDNRTRNYIDRVNFRTEGNLDNVSQPNIQQTMRLMGKDVTVGQSNQSLHGFNDGRVWTEKDVVTNNCHSSRVSDLPLQQQWSQQQWISHRPSGSFSENLFQPLETSSNFYHIPPVGPRLDLMQFDCRPQWISRNGISSNPRNPLKVDFLTHPHISQSMLNDAPRSVQIPMVASNPMNTYQNTLLNSTHCKHSQGIAYSRTSTFQPPFLYQDSQSSIQPSPTTHSSPNLPQWLVNAKQQKQCQGSSSSYSDPVARHQQHSMSHTDLFPLPSSLPTSTLYFPDCTTNDFQKGVQSLSIPAYSTSKFMPSVNNPCRSKNKNKEGTNFNFTYLKCVDVSGKTRKRPAAKDDGFMKPAKKPFLQMQEGPRQSEEIERYNLNINNNNKKFAENSPDMDSEKEVFSNVSVSSSSKPNSQTRHGPVKLSAGAKHILKPSESTDQDNCRTIHSTIPLSIGSTSEVGEIRRHQVKRGGKLPAAASVKVEQSGNPPIVQLCTIY